MAVRRRIFSHNSFGRAACTILESVPCSGGLALRNNSKNGPIFRPRGFLPALLPAAFCFGRGRMRRTASPHFLIGGFRRFPGPCQRILRMATWGRPSEDCNSRSRALNYQRPFAQTKTCTSMQPSWTLADLAQPKAHARTHRFGQQPGSQQKSRALTENLILGPGGGGHASSNAATECERLAGEDQKSKTVLASCNQFLRTTTRKANPDQRTYILPICRVQAGRFCMFVLSASRI